MSDVLASRILYCDAHCVVVNKIAGEAVEGEGKGIIYLPRLLAQLLDSGTGPSAEDVLAIPVAAHRLDVPVSGCVLFARTGAALRFLNASFRGADSFRGNTVEKRYWAIVEAPSPDNAFFSENAANSSDPGTFVELVHWIQFDSRQNKSIAYNEPESRVSGRPGRKKAALRCRLAGRGEHYLFLEIELITGRHHQIRAQLAAMGLHIKGDLKYGAKRSERNGGIRLHARTLSFPDPVDVNKRISVYADPPLRDNLWKTFEELL